MLKMFVPKPVLPEDILHEDGSKSYGNINGGYITIQRPEVVMIVETILKQNKTGWWYMKDLIGLKDLNVISEEEFNQIVRILD